MASRPWSFFVESSKHCVKLLSLILIIRCLTKSNLIQILLYYCYYHCLRSDAVIFIFSGGGFEGALSQTKSKRD